MTGKLDIGRGDDYGAFWRDAKAHAEHVGHHAGTGSTDAHPGAVRVDGTGVPVTGSNGPQWELQFKTGGAQQQTGAVDGNASRADVLVALVKQLQQLVGNGLIGHASTDGTHIYLKPGILGAITDAAITDVSTNPAPPPSDEPDDMDDPTPNDEGDEGDELVVIDPTPNDEGDEGDEP